MDDKMGKACLLYFVISGNGPHLANKCSGDKMRMYSVQFGKMELALGEESEG